MNNRQRKFMNELADLMQKYNASFEVAKMYGDVYDMRFNFGSGKVIHMPCASFYPSKLRAMAKTDVDNAFWELFTNDDPGVKWSNQRVADKVKKMWKE